MPIADALMSAPERRIDLGHATLPYWIIGEGPDLVLVHGWPADARTWRRVVPALAQHFTCHLVDLPGAGLSTWTDATPRRVDGMTASLAAAVEQMQLADRFGVVAFDSGGGFARRVAADLPERIVGLALGNTETPKDYTPLFRRALSNGRLPGSKLMMRLALKSGYMRRKLWLSSVSDPALCDEMSALFTEPMARERRRFDGAMLLADGLRAEHFDGVAEAHPRITAPVKLIWGTRDPWFELDAARRMCGQFGGSAELVEIEGGKLFVHEEFPERFSAEVLAHFEAAFSPAS